MIEDFNFEVLSENLLNECIFFDCGNSDLNEFLYELANNYQRELLGKTYCFTNNLQKEEISGKKKEIVCFFTLSNSSLDTKFIPKPTRNKLNRKITKSKQTKSYPAVLLGRLGVSKAYKRKGIGKEVIDFIIAWFINKDNKTGCRFILVDAYNSPEALGLYYCKDFKLIFSEENDEKNSIGIPLDKELKTRFMYNDLIAYYSNS